MDTKKRILIALGFFILCIGLGYLLYKVFFAPKETPLPPLPTEEISTSTEGQFPQAGLGGTNTSSLGGGPSTLPKAQTLPQGQTETTKIPVTQIVSDSIRGVSAGQNGPHYYNEQDGKFYTLGPDGTPILLDEKTFFNVNQVTWAPNKNESILEYPDGSNIYYNFDTKEQVTLPKHWQEFSFSKSGDKIAAKSIGISNESNWLITSSNNGKNVKLIESLGENSNKVDVNWSPNQQVIATTRTGDALGDDREEVLFVGQNHENFKSIEVEGRGFEGQWSPQGSKLLYSVYNERSDYKPELWVVSGNIASIGSERKLLNLNTWANKCTFQDDQYIYCGVPQQLETGAGFVPTLSDEIPDNIYKIDLQTGAKTPLNLDDQNPHHVNTMFLGKDGKTLYFTDKNYNGLFQIPL